MAVKAKSTITLVRVNDGVDGQGIESTTVTYQAWKDGTTTPTGQWLSKPPATTPENPYLWTRIVIKYTDGTETVSYSIGSTPAGIEVGGRNLLFNSGTFQKLLPSSSKPNNRFIDNTYQKFGNNSVKLMQDNTSGTSIIYLEAFYVDAGDKDRTSLTMDESKGRDLALSLWLYIENVGDVDAYEFRVVYTKDGVTQWNKPNTNYPMHVPAPEDLVPGWQRLYAVFTTPEDTTVCRANFNLVNKAGVGEKKCWISSPKLEFGNRPTDWTPAPEDLQDYADTQIESATQTITESYKSLIDQTADQINLMVNQVKQITDANTSSITGLSNQLQITSEMAQFVKTTTEKLQDAVDGKLSATEVQEWARFDGANLELGASNSPFKCKLSTTELAFYQGANKVAWISNNELNILTAIIAKSIGCGNFTFVDEGDLGFSLI